jgi:hypothetical protein
MQGDLQIYKTTHTFFPSLDRSFSPLPFRVFFQFMSSLKSYMLFSSYVLSLCLYSFNFLENVDFISLLPLHCVSDAREYNQ